MNKTLIKLLAVAGVVTGLSACGNSTPPVDERAQLGPVYDVVNLHNGNEAKFNQYVDAGGLTKFQHNLLGATRVTSLNVRYLKPEFGGQLFEAHIQVFGTPQETREALAAVCTVPSSSFIMKTDPVPSGSVTTYRHGREYKCYYENTNGRGHMVITSQGITVDPLASTRAPGYEN
jgi:hypothetical protein